MIQTTLQALTANRVHVPRWASVPLSGEGAALFGGRANRPGIPALYLSLELQTAIGEYQQLAPLPPPGTLVTYEMTVDPIVDFRGGYSPEQWAPLWEAFMGDWRGQWFDQRIEPPSWVVADEAIEQGAKGILFPSSVVPGGYNLVLYPERFTESDSIRVYDPAGALPKNQNSWQ